MVKSRRVKQYCFTAVSSKVGMEHKEKLVDEIRANVRARRYCYVAKFTRFKTEMIRQIRISLKPGRILMAKNRLMQVAIGVDSASSLAGDIYKLSGLITNSAVLICTDLEKDAIMDIIKPYLDENVAATAGDIATETVIIPAGPEYFESLQHTIEPYLRQLGMPTQLSNGRIVLLGDYTICEQGTELTKKQAQLLKLLGYTLAKREFELVGVHDRTTGSTVGF